MNEKPNFELGVSMPEDNERIDNIAKDLLEYFKSKGVNPGDASTACLALVANIMVANVTSKEGVVHAIESVKDVFLLEVANVVRGRKEDLN